MTRPFDPSKFRKSITKAIPGVSSGFNDPTTWVSTGSYALNYLISSDFNRGIPLSKVCFFAGESGSGKSYIVSGNIVKNAQDQGIFVVLLDSENALDESWLHALGVDTSPDKLMRIGVSMVDEVAGTIGSFMKDYKADYADDKDNAPKVLFVVDSVGMLTTPAEQAQFDKADMKGDMGRKAKQVTALVRSLVNLIAEYQIGVVCTNHTYASQDMFSPDDVISGGVGAIFASSIVVASRKKKLKEDKDGKKVTDILGIKASCKVVKSRYSKPFEQVDLHIPYDTGMDPYSGLFDLFEKTGVLVKQGNRYRYISKVTGEETIEFRKNWKGPLLDIVMNEFDIEDFVPAENIGEILEEGEVANDA